MDGNAFSGIGELIEGLAYGFVFLLGLVIALSILLILSLTTTWSWWFLLIIPVVCSIVSYIGKRLLG